MENMAAKNLYQELVETKTKLKAEGILHLSCDQKHIQ